MLPALPAIWVLLPEGVGSHAGLEEWVQAANSLATAAATCVVIVLALPAIIGVFMLLGGNICMAAKQWCGDSVGIRKPHTESLSSTKYPLLHDVDVDTPNSRFSTRSSADFVSIDGNRTRITSYGSTARPGSSRSTTSINDQLVDLDASKPPCLCVCCARAGCCIMFATAGILFLTACAW